MVVTFDVRTGAIDSVKDENGNSQNGRPAQSHKPKPNEPIKEVFSTAALTEGRDTCFTFIYNGTVYTVCI